MTTETYTLPDLPYDYSALEPHINARIMELHHDKHHATYVKGANTALDRLQEARGSQSFETISMLEKNLAFNVSGHVLHSVFWTNLTPDAPDAPSGPLADAINDTFGGVDAFKAQMTEAAGTVQGAGWALASFEPFARRIVVQQVYDHQGNHGQGTIPLLAIDAWEHAYYLQYENRKTDFFDAIWNVVNWSDMAARYENARQADLMPID